MCSSDLSRVSDQLIEPFRPENGADLHTETDPGESQDED